MYIITCLAGQWGMVKYYMACQWRMHRCLNEKGIHYLSSSICFTSSFCHFIPPFRVSAFKIIFIAAADFFFFVCILVCLIFVSVYGVSQDIQSTHRIFRLLLFNYDECIYCRYYFWHFFISHFCYPAGLHMGEAIGMKWFDEKGDLMMQNFFLIFNSTEIYLYLYL